MNFKGSLSLIILHLLSQEPSHGYQIARDIREQSGGILDFAEGTLYPTLHGLEKQGLLRSYKQKESGRTRRYYRLTDEGHKALAAERKAWHQYSQIVNTIVGEAA